MEAAAGVQREERAEMAKGLTHVQPRFRDLSLNAVAKTTAEGKPTEKGEWARFEMHGGSAAKHPSVGEGSHVHSA